MESQEIDFELLADIYKQTGVTVKKPIKMCQIIKLKSEQYPKTPLEDVKRAFSQVQLSNINIQEFLQVIEMFVPNKQEFMEC